MCKNGEKLYKSNVDKKLAGVCGGIAEYLGMDSTIIRLLLVMAVLCAGVIVAAFVMPDKPN